MLVRLPVLVSVFAFVLAFVAAPYEHLHPDSGAQHAHVTPHEHGHHHDEGPAPGEEHHDAAATFVSMATFIAAGAVHGVTVDAMQGPARAVAPVDVTVTKLLAPPEPHSHGPPAARSLTPRAPPA
jgi:hypothetical protein